MFSCSACLLEKSAQLSPIVPLDPSCRAVVEAVHSHVFVVVAAEDLGNEKPVGKISAVVQNLITTPDTRGRDHHMYSTCIRTLDEHETREEEGCKNH